jgi:hypothetical protein
MFKETLELFYRVMFLKSFVGFSVSPPSMDVKNVK